jgi:hypothetical protein
MVPILLSSLFTMALFVFVDISKFRITFAKLVVCYIGIDLTLEKHFDILFGVKASIRCPLSFFANVTFLSYGIKVVLHAFDHRLKQIQTQRPVSGAA